MNFLRDFLKISTVPSLLYVLAIIFAIIIIILVRKYTKSWIKSMVSAVVLGLTISIIFSALNDFNGVEEGTEGSWQGEVSFWGDLIANVFYNSTSIILPFVLFASIVVALLKYHSDSSKSVLKRGFRNVLGVFLIGITITVLVSLFFFLIDFRSLFGTTLEEGHFVSPVPLGTRIVDFIPSSIEDFFNITQAEGSGHSHGGVSVSGIISAVVAGIVFGIVFIRLRKKNKDSKTLFQIERGLLGFSKIMNGLLSFVMTGYLPIALLGFITTGLFEGGVSQLINGGVFIGFMVLVLILIWITLTIINFFLTKDKNRKKLFKSSFPVLITAFFSQSSQATLPLTRSVLKKDFQVKELVADAIPTFVASGLSIACTGAFPLLTSLVIANNLGQLDVLFYIQAVIIVTILAFGMAGVPGDAAVASTNATRSLFSSNSKALTILGIILSTDLLSEMLRTATNVYGAMTATLLTNRELKNPGRFKKLFAYRK